MSNKPQPSDTAGTQNENNNPGLLTHLGERIGDIEDEIKAVTDTVPLQAARDELLQLRELMRRVVAGEGAAVEFEIRRDIFTADIRCMVKDALFEAKDPHPFIDAITALDTAATYDDASYAIAMAAELLVEQGSGKSISMACYAGMLLQQPEMNNPTLVVVTDRNDLDGQLYQQFCSAKDLLKQDPEQADSRDELREKLAARKSGGIIFTTVQKFSLPEGETNHPELCDRHNVVVISDEAHRSQYGLTARLDKKTGIYKFGYAKHMRDALAPDEIAFYDALAERPEVLQAMGDETLKSLASELTEKLRASTSVDWQVRDSVRAKMRLLIKRLLRKYKYPPKGYDEAVKRVIEQAEVLADLWSD